MCNYQDGLEIRNALFVLCFAFIILRVHHLQHLSGITGTVKVMMMSCNAVNRALDKSP